MSYYKTAFFKLGIQENFDSNVVQLNQQEYNGLLNETDKT